ncbi:unnamed protein product [Paramecium sonneborni]|uniref:Protein kinase domain-containing protein n=1 Tax=Paramecium sonneborni TaxID=65129 RepID=A0A8S1N736_9CILI|nr:unnamed protein product [Paramecium sonneborni]
MMQKRNQEISRYKIRSIQHEMMFGQLKQGVIWQDKLYAMKQIKKKLVLKKQQLENILYERFILQKYDHTFIIKIYFVYQEPLFINMVMEFIQGGELFYHLNKRKKFDQKTTAFFTSQIVLALEFLHEAVGVAYRDLKPENVLLCKDGYIKLADMGLAKNNNELNYSFCGCLDSSVLNIQIYLCQFSFIFLVNQQQQLFAKKIIMNTTNNF